MRYFYFAGISSAGYWGMSSTSEKFPSQIDICEAAAEQCGVTPENIVILGWQEFKSKEDFNSYVATNTEDNDGNTDRD